MSDHAAQAACVVLTTPLGQASRQALQNAVAGILLGMPKLTWGGRVVEVRDGVVYLNAGADQGIRVGMELDAFEIQPTLIDPDTGKNLGAPDRMIGSLTVSSVLEKFSTARIVAGEGISRGNIVRLKVRSSPP